jgi:lipopolysaccharide/colanic/teichoic acid biosynthesis glycosyltransferase
MIKRAIDLIFGLFGLLLMAPVMVIVALAVKFDSKGPVFFLQERVGLGFRMFKIYKFRTMVENAPSLGGPITFGDDPRTTRIGRVLRKTKIDELPQIINVIKGDMSLVGPRPEVSEYVELFRKDYEEILKIRPGITDLASLKYRDEAALLGKAEDPEEEYRLRILPDKVKLAKEYLNRASLLFDLTLVVRTVLTVLISGSPSRFARQKTSNIGFLKRR